MLIARLQSLGLVVGPALFALSPLFWVGGHYGIVGGMLIAVATVPWVYGLLGEYGRLRPLLPRIAGLWLLLVLLGMFGTIAFGLQGFFEGVFGVADRTALDAFADYPPWGAAVLLLSGPVFPFALLILGILHWRTRLSPRWTAGLLCAAAVLFPLARLLRLEPLAVAADLLMLAAFCVLAWRSWPRR
ncbi:hypothetical protein KNO15_13235 [Leifsonia shinshuensis]|uniref:hypothetical protein n=1 Tax=Leifsonia shinshuensis TaxID=150026 RepID=UPI001F51013C|nr:hypothetical protein [Leifsonia shinshuensis]MCI0157658.1 hypothetical protein [Leifsonia shinshuensis]